MKRATAVYLPLALLFTLTVSLTAHWHWRRAT